MYQRTTEGLWGKFFQVLVLFLAGFLFSGTAQALKITAALDTPSVQEGGNVVLTLSFTPEEGDQQGECGATVGLSFEGSSASENEDFKLADSDQSSTEYTYGFLLLSSLGLKKAVVGTVAGVTSTETIRISTFDNTLFEPQESVIINFDVTRGANVSDCRDGSTRILPSLKFDILDDEPPVEVGVTSDKATINEGDGSFSIQVDYTGDDQTTSCNVTTELEFAGTAINGTAASGGDYSEQIVLLRRDVSGDETITFDIHDDDSYEGLETIQITPTVTASGQCHPSTTSGVLPVLRINLEDNDPVPLPDSVGVDFSIDNPAPEEGETSYLVVSYTPDPDADGCHILGTLSQTGGTATEGSDFSIGSIAGGVNLDYESGDDPATGKEVRIPLNIIDDTLDEADETRTFRMEFASQNQACEVSSASLSRVLTIRDNDVTQVPLVVSLTADNANPSESDETVNFAVSFDLQGGAAADAFCDVEAVLRIVPEETTATLGVDFIFNPQTITFGGNNEDGNQKNVEVPLTILQDTQPESAETITVEAAVTSNDVNGQSSCPLSTELIRATTSVTRVTITLRDDNDAVGTPRTVTEANKESCTLLEATANTLTAAQANRLDICRGNPNPTTEELAPDPDIAGTALMDATKIQTGNVQRRLLAIRRGGTRKLDSSGVNMRINGEAVPSGVFEGSGSGVFELGGDQNDPLPDNIFNSDSPDSSVHEEEGGVFEVKGGGGSADDINDLIANSRWGFFVNGDFIFGEKDEATGERGFDFDSRGLTVGLDYRLPGEKLVVGSALGYNDYESSFSNARGGMDLRGVHLSSYATYGLSDRGYIDGIVSFGRNRIDMRRPALSVPGALPAGSAEPLAIGKPDGDELGISIGAGYDFRRRALSITPYGRIDYTRATIDAYQEEVSHPSAIGSELSIGKQTLSSTNTVLGVRGTYAVSTPRAVILPQASIEWRHQFEDDIRQLDASFVHDPNQALFQVTSDKVDRDYLNLGMGVSAVWPGGRTGFLYIESKQGQDQVKETAIRAGVRIEF